MSDVLSTVKESFEDAFESVVGTLREWSAQAPGSSTTQALVVGVVVGTVGYLLMKKKRNLPPGPFAWPLLGNISLLMAKEPGFKCLDKMVATYGPVITVYMGPIRTVTLNRLDVIREALVTKGADFAGRPQFYSIEMFTEGFKDILFAHDSAAWKLHRKIATNALRLFMKGQNLETAVHHVVSMAVDRMLAEKEPIQPMRYMVTMMFHTISVICFGECRDWDDQDIKVLADMFDVLTNDFGNGFWEDVLPPLRKFPTGKFKRFQNATNTFLGYIYKNIAEHRKTFNPDHIRDIVDSVLAAQKEAEKEESAEVMAMFTNTHVGETISDIFGGGVDTSRMTLF
jgi:steroid 17alpha-monooxygenase/17alpha-hydroxyprogesterone aldolase/cytochrome P450 family 1 subfamily A polypeptide 1